MLGRAKENSAVLPLSERSAGLCCYRGISKASPPAGCLTCRQTCMGSKMQLQQMKSELAFRRPAVSPIATIRSFMALHPHCLTTTTTDPGESLSIARAPLSHPGRFGACNARNIYKATWRAQQCQADCISSCGGS